VPVMMTTSLSRSAPTSPSSRFQAFNNPLDSATLHRHFSGRVALVHAVLDSEAGRLAARAVELSSRGQPEDALRVWLLELVRFSTSYRGLAVLLAANDADTTSESRHHALTDACRLLLTSAQADGRARTTIDAGDLLKLTHGIAVASAGSPDVASRLLDMVTDGLRAPR
jgi:AcrR family transcriptional regulator